MSEQGAKKAKSDFWNYVILELLYLSQEVIAALLTSLPLIMKKYTNYTNLGILSMALYPFTFKFIWAPFVDSVYLKSIGRRKTWVVPLQILSGIILSALSFQIDDLVRMPAKVPQLTLILFLIIFFLSIRDIAVDGWALTMLEPENLVYASTLKGIGRFTGAFLSVTFLTAFNSVEFCNTYLYSEKKDDPLLECSHYFLFWGILCIILGLSIALFKSEKSKGSQLAKKKMTLKETISGIVEMFRKPNLRSLMALFFFRKFGVSAVELTGHLYLIDKGFGKEAIAICAAILWPAEIIFAIISGQYSKTHALKKWMEGYVEKFIMHIIFMIFIFYAPTGEVYYTRIYYILFFIIQIGYCWSGRLIYVSGCVFINKISDKKSIGGTYVTLLNTISDLGRIYPNIIVMVCVDLFGFFHTAIVFNIIAVITYWYFKPVVDNLDDLPNESWLCDEKKLS